MTSTETLHSDGGSFGAFLGDAGFGEGVRGDHWNTGPFWYFDHASDLFRVIVFVDDADRVEIIGWDPERPASKLEVWRVQLTGSTPLAVAEAAVKAAIGSL